MAVGPFARILAQIVVPVVAVLARALPAAYSQALQNARKAGVDATAEAAAPVFGKRISRSEALQVLNLTEAEAANPEAIQKQFERYFAANDVKKGGSFYLQSKIYRAHEQLMEFQKEKRQEEQQEQQQQQQEGGSGDK
mmetsp:Transcript_29887/g.72435  ORF Transcript_29887/g.72435 Transcript_29887/m.72435 type:complete len:138 (+) Transcript_29887:252-665(+)|eukprot:CAMPEP_0113468656 /NCGR_PEP_ID=MMETSP0014_2-20120614/15474_1 /TAXON_ID=2857 /ORGANISM="Nitzschia sp." /LENGTH=137 /DNA_ID=CAMNT_0000361065 /DNA_START=240 /DNA_END=653 /DNA_ORIENTATION=+ /assembly_acc=CAM_ASM_000159